jgi:putative ABC transport system ATP-binding protein
MSDGELAALRRETLGFVFQQFNLNPTLSARQNVEAALAPGDLRANDRHRRAMEMLDRVGLAARSDLLPLAALRRRAATGGDRASALDEPRVLLADEPTGNLNTATGEEIVELLAGLWEPGLSIVLVTHDHSIAGHAQRIVRMQDGRLTETDTADEPRRLA